MKKKHESCEEEKAEKKYVKNLEVREGKAKKLGRFIHPLIYKPENKLDFETVYQHSQNHFYLEIPLRLVIPVFADQLRRDI